MTGAWCQVTGDRWTYTLDASHIRGDATKMEPIPGSTALRGGDPTAQLSSSTTVFYLSW